MAAAPSPTTSGIKQNQPKNKLDEKSRPPTVEELLIQIENHLYNSIEHRASLLIAAWTCLGGQIGYFRNIEKVFHMLYKESALMIFSRHWTKVDILFKRGLSRAIIQYSHTMGSYVKRSEGLCSALVMAAYDPWGDPVIRQLLSKEDIDLDKVKDFVKSEPFELLLIRVECLVNARCEEAAIRLCRSCLQAEGSLSAGADSEFDDGHWRLSFMEWLLRLLFRKRRLNDLITETSSCSCHDGVRLIYRTLQSEVEDSEPLTESLINLFLVRDLLFKSNYCCTSDLMKLWCELQAKKQKPLLEIQEAARKLLVGHASSSAQFYLFVDILWGKFGISLLPLYLELYVRGLTSDLNFLEAARQTDKKDYVIELENHMAAMYFKLSSLFSSLNKEISLECLLSAFSLNPTKEVLEWIKKMTLQISKENAQKNCSNIDSSKHKNACSHSHNCANPVSLKRKAVVMCDQAIQVGDDSFMEHDTSTRSAKVICQRSQTPVKGDNSNDIKQLPCEVGNLQTTEISDNNTKSKTCIDSLQDKQIFKDNEKPRNTSKCPIANVKEITPNAVVENVKCSYKSLTTENRNEFMGKDKTEQSTGEIRSNFEKTNCISNDNASTSTLDHNHIIPNDCKTSNSSKCEDKNVYDKLNLKESDNCKNQLSTQTAICEALTNHHINGLDSKKYIDNSADQEKTNQQEKEGITKAVLDVANSNLTPDAVVLNKCENPESLLRKKVPEACNNVCVNGYETEKTVSVAHDSGLKISSCIEIHREEKNKARNETTVDEINKNVPSVIEIEKTSAVKECFVVLNKSAVLEKNIYKHMEQNKLNINLNHNNSKVARVSEFVKNQSTFTSFSHVILDCNLPGLSSNLLSDFVIVLESLRNKQLRTSSKWSEIKHLCEEYLDVFSDQRCMMLNLQLNGSVDSEADSTSELTGNDFKDFDFHQSNDSVREDNFADKSHVFKRFMNSDKVTEMATYVNLSDIHCPQIPLEKLFYTEYSSSHPGHKKRHKKHRNHDKNPKKLVLRKLRHGNRADCDVVKHKKRKKRKGKRGKGHVKKHHSAHTKEGKLHAKNKRKKHKLKKKKEGNSGFISGDYCSDFSSEELMRIVKEHSNSYSKVPATTSKHPHTVGSDSSDSEEPARKKRKVTFDKKRGKNEKYHDKHKHVKSKSNKHKKKITVESCKASVTNIIHDNNMNNDLNANKDYPHFVQISRVKKMESVQIQQRSVSMLENSVSEPSLISPCVSNPQIQQFVQQNFESYSPEDMVKMQLLMARQQAEVTAGSSTMVTNQALRKYVCSKILSVAQSSKCIVGSDSEASKSPTPICTDKLAKSSAETLAKSRGHPQKISANIKHFVIETSKGPYKLPNTSTSTTASSNLVPMNLSGNTYSEAQNLIGAMLNSNIRCPTTQMTPQVTALSIPISHNSPGTKMVTSKIIIPLPPNSNLRGGQTSPNVSLVPSETSNFTSTSGNTSHSSFIIVKNGNNTQIIQSPQNPCNILPCISNSNVSVTSVKTKVNPVVATRGAPKMIKQAAKKSSQPVVKRSLIKNPAPIKNTITAPNVSLSKTPPKVSAPAIALAAPPPKHLIVPATEANCLTSIASEPNIDLTSQKVPIPLPISPVQTVTEVKNPIPISKSNTTEMESPISLSTKLDAINDAVSIKSEISLSLTSTPPISKDTDDTNTSVTKVSKENECIQITSNSEETPKDKKETLSLPVCPVDSATSINKEEKEIASIEKSSEIETESCSEKSSEKTEQMISASPEDVGTKAVTVERAIIPTPQEELDIGETSEKSDSSPTEETELHSTESIVEESSVTETAEDKNIEKDSANSPAEDVNNSKESLSLKIKSVLDSEAVVEPESAKASPVKLDQEITSQESTTSLSPESKESDTTPSKSNAASNSDQQKQLQPINSVSIMASLKAPGKTSSPSKADGASVSEVPTRSFTSISDAVRFSLMDMDDATDSVENQVLQAFQVSHETAPQNSPRYDNNSTGDGNGRTSPSAVILTAPESTSTTDLNISRVSQRFETTVHSSQGEKFSDCQSTVSRSTTWILEDTSINETSQTINIQKSTDLDSSGEGKDDEKPKKKKKRKDRGDRDPESAHKFWCEICHKGFFSAYNLRRHCRNVHKMNLPKGTTDLPFASNSHSHQHIQQGESSSSEIVSPPRIPYGSSQSSCVSPKGSDYMLQSPTREAKSQDFSTKVPTSQHTSPIQSDFQMQTGTRITGQSPSSHISSSPASKSIQSDFQLPTPTTVSGTHVSPNKLSSVAKSPTSSKFQRLPTPCSSASVSQMSPISACAQQSALQQQRQLNQIQSSGLIQPVPSVACQAQQLQASQCPHFQSKQIAQQRIGQLQLMHHAAQLPTVQHSTLGMQKQTPSQQYKKCSSNLQSSKMTETEQIQQTAQLAQTQQILANQQMQKLMQIRQNAIAATGVATQLSLGATVPGAQGSNVKTATQCFQSQLAVARQAAAVAQLSATQRAQGASFTLASHDSAAHQFFAPSVQPNPEQSSCSHASFAAQNLVEYSANAPSYPTIRLSSEANDGLEDLEQFLLENMPWSSDQAASHSLAQQSGNRPSSADSLTLSIPTPASSQMKSKTPITRPKPRKPVVTSCSKNLLGNLGRGVKKKSAPKKTTKITDINCPVSKPGMFPQSSGNNQQSHGLDLMQMHCDKVTSSNSKQVCKTAVNETDSSDSVQCINVGHHISSKNASAGINFNTFMPAAPSIVSDKSINPSYNMELSNQRMFAMQSKNSFLEHGNLVNKNSSNLNKSNVDQIPCDVNPAHLSNSYSHTEKSSFNPAAAFCQNVCSPIATKRSETGQDIFLGQRNSEIGEASNNVVKDNCISNTQTVANTNCYTSKTDKKDQTLSSDNRGDLFLGGRIGDTNNSSGSSTDNTADDSVTNTKTDGNTMDKKYDNIDVLKEMNNELNSDADEKIVIQNSSIGTISDQESIHSSKNAVINKNGDNSSSELNKENGTKHNVYGDISNIAEECIGKNSTLNLEQMQELDMKTVMAPNSLILKEKPNPSECKFNSAVSKNIHSSKQNFNGFSVSRILDNDSSPDGVNSVSAKKIDNKENVSYPSPVGTLEHTKSVFKNCDKGALLPKHADCEKDSSHEKTIANGEKHSSEVRSEENENIEQTTKRVALSVRKSLDICNKFQDTDMLEDEGNENDLNVKHYLPGKITVDSKTNRRNCTKKKIIQENTTLNVECKDQNEMSELKLDINSNIQQPFNEEKEVNGEHCLDSECCQNIGNKLISKETEENDPYCTNTKQEDIPVGLISSSRLRLRDTPKTSVKRVCPCCIDSRVPKKCRTPITKLVGNKVNNSVKNKTTLKTRNASNIQNAKVNTRSSQRLRSRNNAVS